MIGANLSTRPFYNERAVRVWIGVLALVVAAVTLFNVSRVLLYSRSDTELKAQAARDEARVADLRAEAGRLRSSVDARQVDMAAVEAQQANDLIDRRTFSWTELFNRFEATLPRDVRITSVRPNIDNSGRIVLSVSVIAQSVDDVDEFLEGMEGTGAFSRALSREERVNEQGQIEALLETIYAPRPGGA
jgi:Tfp pilus assembly protein PilN